MKKEAGKIDPGLAGSIAPVAGDGVPRRGQVNPDLMRPAGVGVDLKKIELPNSPLYRDDIGEKVKPALEALHKHGYARGMRY